MAEQPVEDVMPVINLSVRISKPIDEVWESFLNPVIMTQWLGNEISADMDPDGYIRFSGKNAPAIPEMENIWRIKRFKEPRAILFSWNILGSDTLFVIRFVEIPTGTQIDVKHGAIPDSAKALHLTDHWNILLANFKAVIELGEPALKFDYSNYHPLRVTPYDPLEVRQSVIIKAPPILPYDVFVNPEKLRHFIRADDPVVDRQFAGIYTWWAEGKGPHIFRKLVPEKEIEFTWAFDDLTNTIVNIRFEEVADATLVSLHHHSFQKQEDVVGYDVVWTSVLCELKLVCELGESGIDRVMDWS